MIAARILRESHEENIDIMLEWDFGCIPKIGNNLKTNEYFFNKIWTVHVYGKKPYVEGHVLFI